MEKNINLNHRNLIFLTLVIIVFFALFLRLYNISGHDMAIDDVLYSFRSIGYIDYVANANMQSTPIIWFSEPQWWQNLSFHDHPPLVFIVQWFFFKIGGVNNFTARLPFVLAGVLSVLFLFFLGKLLFNTKVGIFSSIALAILNYAIWISRIGFLEGFLILWIILSIYFFVKAKEKPINYLWWCFFLAMGALTKYTFLFVAPAFLLSLLIYRRSAFKEKWFYFGIFLFFVIISPVIIYNLMMWQTRGHFDAAFSTVVGQHPDDFQGLVRQTNKDINILSAVKKIITDNFSIGFQIILVFSLVLFIFKFFKNKKNSENYFIILSSLFFGIISLSLVGGGESFGVIILPFSALITGYLGSLFFEISNKWGRNILIATTILICIWELFLATQSQLIDKLLIRNSLMVSKNSLNQYRGGYNQLEKYIDDFYKKFSGQPIANMYMHTPQLAQYQNRIIEKLLEKNSGLSPYRHLLVADNRLAWFQFVWIFERRILYEATPIQTLLQFLETMQNKGSNFYTNLGLEDATIIIPTEDTEQNNLIKDKEIIRDFTNQLEKSTRPIDEIKSSNNKIIFKIFRIPLKNLIIK